MQEPNEDRRVGNVAVDGSLLHPDDRNSFGDFPRLLESALAYQGACPGTAHAKRPEK